MLVERMVSACEDDATTRYLIDTFCGSGLFSLALAHVFDRVYGIEISKDAVRAANANANANGIENVSFRVGDSDSIFSSIAVPPDQTCIIIDPPRAGCSDSFLSQLLLFGPRKVLYVSCNPTTFARDARALLRHRQYQVDGPVLPFDMFRTSTESQTSLCSPATTRPSSVLKQSTRVRKQ